MPCYASPLGDCSGPLSLEHYVSHSILKLLSPGGGVFVGGPRFLNGERRTLPPSTLGSKVLCSHHNSALSPLDSEALRFFEAISAVQRFGSNSTSLKIKINGGLLERWILKVYLGIAASGSMRSSGGYTFEDGIPESLIRVLFGKRSHVAGTGLFLDMEPGRDYHRTHHGLTIVPWLNEQSSSASFITVDFNNVHLFYPIDHNVPRRGYHRPAHIRFTAATSSAVALVGFTWPTHIAGNHKVTVRVIDSGSEL